MRCLESHISFQITKHWSGKWYVEFISIETRGRRTRTLLIAKQKIAGSIPWDGRRRTHVVQRGCVGPPTTHTYNAYISSCRTNDIHMRMARNNTWFLLLCSALPLMRCRGHSSQRICYIWFSSLHSSWNWDVYYVCHWHKGQGVLDEGRESKEFQVICSLIRAPRRCYIYRICAERKKEREKGHNAVFDRTMGHMCADRCEMRPASIVWMVPTRPYAADAAVR